MSDTTIAAISTPPGSGGIAVIRVSGHEAISITDQIFVPLKKGESVAMQKSYTLSLGKIMKEGEELDEVLLSVFRAPHSYTGEDIVEITCHGSIYIQQELIRLLIDKGCVLAAPGEFTQRAFLNGKMDLSQAEAVADLIASSSVSSHRLAVNQMRGGFSKELKTLREHLLNFVSLIELELDFSEEDVEFADRSKLMDLAETIHRLISQLVSSFSLGNVIKNGVPVVIVGETNSGKSTLLNQLLNEDKAIVSEISGTTRDVIEDIVNLGGITFRFIDTAGIRETENEIENMGIERTFQKIAQASIVIWMIDSTNFDDEIDHIADQILPVVKEKQLIIVFNKSDKLDPEEKNIIGEEFLPGLDVPRIYMSAKYKENIEQLQELLIQKVKIPELGENNVIVTNVRHYEALKNALASIKRVIDGLHTNLSGDFLSQDIRECLHYLGTITGQITNDEILQNIFSKFCIGK